MKKWFLVGLLVVLAACSDSSVPTTELDPTIVGGQNAQANEFPFMVGIWRNTNSSSHDCGAALLSDTWLVTAAHCVQGKEGLIFVAGEHRRSVLNGLEQGRRAARIIIHPNFRVVGPRFENDIALVELAGAFNLTNQVQPIAYADTLPAANTSVRTIGWGRTSGGGAFADVLQKATITLRSQQRCGDTNGFRFCAIDSAPVVDACGGDSGGPVFKDGELIGLTSFGPTACDSKGFYTNVAFFSNWIEEQTGIASN